MRISSLLRRRDTLLKQAYLANLAHAHQRLARIVERIARTGLRGWVRLQPADPEAGHYGPTLKACRRSPAFIEEHFTEEDIAELAQVIEFATEDYGAEQIFRLEELGPRYLQPIRAELERAGVRLVRRRAPAGAVSGTSSAPGRAQGGRRA